MTRFARKVDLNQAEIVAALRADGWEVRDMHKCGYGIYDLLVRKGGLRFWIEVKQPGEQLTPAEDELLEWIPGRVFVVQDAQQAVDLLAPFEREA